MFKSGIFIIILLMFAFQSNSYSQDTTKKKIDTTYKSVRFIQSEYKYKYLNQTNPDTITRKRFLWYPAKNFEDIFNNLPGYYLKYMDVGQINQLNYNQLNSYNESAVLRHGRPMNDLIDGTIDYNLFSRNEVAEIELADGFPNVLYNYSNVINIIDRQIFQYRPYTEISFFQDRYENLYFDGNYHQNLFRNFNLNIGITKHSYDGKYPNSDFDKWLGRFNFNLAASNKLSFFLYSNYAKIQRGLNDGVNPDTVNIGSREDMFDISKAIVRNSDAYEIKERFDVDAGGVLLAGKNSYTKLQMFVSNSFRKYRDEENRPNPNGKFIKTNLHWIDYGIKLQQIFNFKLGKSVDLISRTEGEFDYIIMQENTSTNSNLLFLNNLGSLISRRYHLLENIDINYKNLSFTEYINWRTFDDFKTIYYRHGGKLNYRVKIDSLNRIILSAFYNSYKYYSGASVGYQSPNINLSSEFYMHQSYEQGEEKFLNGINNTVKLRIFKFDVEGLYSNSFSRNEYLDIMPQNYGNISLAFHDVAFKNKLEYKIGINSRFWSKYRTGKYDSFNNMFTYVDIDTVNNTVLSDLYVPANGTLDFFIMGRIGRATFGLTLENILNRLVYNTGVYPFMDRGGLFNVISRFNITWNFLD